MSQIDDAIEILDNGSARIPPKDMDTSHDINQATKQSFTDTRRKNGELSVYRYYMESSGYTSVSFYMGFIALWILLTEFPSKDNNHRYQVA